MTFPVYMDIGPWSIHPHLLFEALAYFIGFRIYLYTRNRDRIPMHQAIWVIVGAIIGAALGSKILYWLEDPVKTVQHITDPFYLMAGKTIVGGLLGGLIGVEWSKKILGLTRSTGDDFVLPLIVGMILGRVGCFLTGLSDHTHGNATTWVTGIDFGDGVLRHPTQLYEIAFLFGLFVFFLWMRRANFFNRHHFPEGTQFQWFMIGYLCFRFAVEFIKPVPQFYWGLNHIQVAAILGLIYYVNLIRRWLMQNKKKRGNVHA